MPTSPSSSAIEVDSADPLVAEYTRVSADNEKRLAHIAERTGSPVNVDGIYIVKLLEELVRQAQGEHRLVELRLEHQITVSELLDQVEAELRKRILGDSLVTTR